MNQKVNDKSTRKCTESQYAITGDNKTMLNEKARTTPTDGIEMPSIAGLRCRGFRGEADYPAMAAVIAQSKEADKQDFTETADDLRRQYQHLVNSDPFADMLFVEIGGEVVGYSRIWWQQVVDGPRVYSHFANLVPAWREQGIRRAMVRHNEARIREIAAAHGATVPRVYECWASDGEKDWMRVLKGEGYEVVRYGFAMVRPSLDSIPELPLPEGIEVRPARPEHYDRIWDAARQAFRDHWGFSEEEWAHTYFESWQQDDTFQPHLWQVAWDGDEVAGMILNFIHEAENREYHRLRGYTETICVRRPWRRRGLARALIARSLAVLKAEGMTEAALGVDADNPNGAL
ncbi:MAG: GNAT family N-acetyltransferase, partial [Anaerolineae bacterium]